MVALRPRQLLPLRHAGMLPPHQVLRCFSSATAERSSKLTRYLASLQICCLVIAPTFYSAALYWAAGLAIANVAPQKSWLSGRAFKTFFIAADLVSLIVQAVGGGMAGSAVGTDPQQVETGSK